MKTKARTWPTVLIVAALAGYCWIQWYRMDEFAAFLDADPVFAEAIIMEKKRSSGSNYKYGRSSDHYTVIARFDVPGGARVSASTEISEGRYAGLQVGDPVTLRFARSDPTIAEIEVGTFADKAKFYLLGATLASALLTLGGMIAVAYHWAVAQASRVSKG